MSQSFAIQLSDILPNNSYHRSNHLARPIYPHELVHFSSPHSLYHPRNYYTGYQRCPNVLANLHDVLQSQNGERKTIIDEDHFHVSLDVHQFTPSEISVKMVGRSVVVTAKHEERQDNHGYVSRQFIRRYTLPKGFSPDHVVPELSSDGILTIKATTEDDVSSEERNLQIRHTGPAVLYVKDKDKVEDGETAKKEVAAKVNDGAKDKKAVIQDNGMIKEIPKRADIGKQYEGKRVR